LLHTLLFFALSGAPRANPSPAAEPILAQIDWQAHPAMHIPWKMFGRGLTDRGLERRTWRHQFRQTVSAPALADSGVRILLAAAMAAERARSPRQARRLILRQLEYVEAFVERHPERYALASTPALARELLETTDKTVIIHSIEGGHHLLWQHDDAREWAARGVALITLIHLRDREFGGAALLEGLLGPLINRWGVRARRRGSPRGLTPFGEATIRRLNQAGILVDYSHMAAPALADALALSAREGIPPVLTHNDLAIDGPFSITDAQLVEIYRLGGVFSSGLSANDAIAEVARPPLPDDLCWGTLEAWGWQHQRVQRVLQEHVAEIFQIPGLTAADLSEDQRIRLATGWSSDWNGWVSHSRPVAPDCRPVPESALAIDTRGLAHPGLLPQHWQRLEERGVDLRPMLRSAERFLQLWESARER